MKKEIYSYFSLNSRSIATHWENEMPEMWYGNKSGRSFDNSIPIETNLATGKLFWHNIYKESDFSVDKVANIVISTNLSPEMNVLDS